LGKPLPVIGDLVQVHDFDIFFTQEFEGYSYEGYSYKVAPKNLYSNGIPAGAGCG
jgi:hypothetical protein